MADVVVIVGVLAFFAVCVALVRGLDHLLGPDDEVVTEPTDQRQRDEIAGAPEAGR